MQILVDLPDDMEQEVSFTLTGRALEHQKKTAVTAALTQAAATIEAQREMLAFHAKELEAALNKNREQSTQLREAAQVMAEQSRRIKELEGTPQPFEPVPPSPPVIVPPGATHPPVIVPVPPAPPIKPPAKDEVFPLVMAYFEDPRPSDSVDDQAQAKEHADAIIPSMVFAAETNPAMDDFIAFCNPEDVKWKALPRTMLDLKKRWWQSPIQAFYIPGAQTQTVLIDHLKKLHDAGMYGAIIDDAHNLTAPDMEHLIDLINLYCPGAPVMASFGADFDDIKEGYPSERYYDMRQWFLRTQEKESVYFQKWETAHDAQLYAAHVYRDKKGFQHTPDRIRSMFATALPFVDGIAWYSLVNKETNIMNDHKKMKAQNPKAVTVWDVIVDCTNDYLKAYAARHVKVS